MTKERDSNIELLRVISYFGIVLMHVYGNFMPEAKAETRICGIAINCFFNTGVSLFILISGYYGIKLKSYKKLISFYLYLLFYSLLGEIFAQAISSSFSIRNIITAFFPIYTRRYWFMSTYFLLLIFSPWINKIANTLSEKELRRFCLTLLIVFSVIPSCIGWTFFGDQGKGIGNMFLIYMLGQYFAKYLNKYQLQRKQCMCMAGITFLIMFILTVTKTVLKREIGMEAPFFRDASIFTVILSISIFLYFTKIHISSSIINFVAKRGIGIFLIDGIIIKTIMRLIDIPQTNEGLIYCLGTTLIIMILGIIIEIIRCPITSVIESILVQIFESLRKILSDSFRKLKNKIRYFEKN